MDPISVEVVFSEAVLLALFAGWHFGYSLANPRSVVGNELYFMSSKTLAEYSSFKEIKPVVCVR